MKVLRSDDAVAVGESGKVGIIYSIEGCSGPLGGNIDNLKKFYDKGLRHAGITHGQGGPDHKYLQGTKSVNNVLKEDARAERLKTDKGLTPFGIEALKAMNELGIVVDLAHSNDRTFYDVLEKSTSSPIVSHTLVYAICQQGRCMTDDQIKAMAAKGGVMGMTFVPDFIANNRSEVSLDKFIDHICHTVDLVGIDYVGIGSDFDGGGKMLLRDVSQLVLLTQGLLNRGFSKEEIVKIWGSNFLRILKQVIDK
jgi:membrane dipeptidase